MSQEQYGGWARPEGTAAPSHPGPASSSPAAPPVYAGWGEVPGGRPGHPIAPAPPKPGVIALRPLGVGEILDGAISAIRAHPRIMLGLSALIAVATQVLTVPITWVLLHDLRDQSFGIDRPTTTDEQISLTASTLSATGIQVAVTLVAALVLTGVLTVVVSRAVLGRDIGAREAWTEVRPRLLALVGVTVLVFAIILGLLVVTVGPGVVLAVAGAPGAAVAIALLLGIPALIAGSVYTYVSFALAPVAIVLEKQGVVASLRRSQALVKGAWWRTFAILVLVYALAQVVSGVLGVVFTALTFLAAFLTGDGITGIYHLVPLLVSAVGTIVTSTITWPFTAVATALLYVDRRIRREALDLELARAAGVARAQQPSPPYS